MKKINKNDIDNSKLSNEEKKLFEKIMNDFYSEFIILKKEKQSEYYELNTWTEEDLENTFLSSLVYPVKEVSKEIFEKEVELHIENKTYILFDNLTKYEKEYENIICYVNSKTTKENIKVSILVLDTTMDIDIVQAAKDFYKKLFKNFRGILLENNEIDVKIK